MSYEMIRKVDAMSTIAFFPATWNLAETTRTIQVAKACKDDFNISFASYGGQFEELVEKAGFALTRLSPRLSPTKIEHMYKVDQGEKLGSFFSVSEVRERVKNEVQFLEKLRPLASVTGFNTTITLSSRVANVPLVWLTQSTWDFDAMMDQGLASYMDDLDRSILRHLPESWLKWLSKRVFSFVGRIALKPLNRVAGEYGLDKLREIRELWNSEYNLLAEPDDFSGLHGIQQTSRYIGPLIAALDLPVPQSVQDFADKDMPLVYFAMGSSGRPSVLKAILEGFRGQPFHVVSPMKSMLKGLNVDIPDNILLTGWLPALEVSRIADISVIHGGIGTVMTAALAGKPVVGVGMMPEQEYNIDCLVRKGFAKRIRRTRVSPHLINEAVLTLLNDETAKRKASEYARNVESWLNRRDWLIKEFFQALDTV